MKQYPVRKIVVLLFVVLIVIYASEIYGRWFDPHWASRRPITIDNTNNSCALHNFQVGITIPYYGGMQNDFDDIRFTMNATANSDLLSLPYWIEEYSISEYAIVWVKVPYIPASNSTTVYLYYRNPNTLSESDGPAVFEFFDDFNDQDISDWTIINGSWTADNRFLEQFETANHRQALSPFSLDSPSLPFVIEARINYMSSYHYSGIHVFLSDDIYGYNGYKYGFAGLNVNGSRIVRIINGDCINIDSDPAINNSNYPSTWIKLKAFYDPAGHYSCQLRTPDNVEVLLDAWDTHFSPPFILGAYVGSHIGIDDLRVRKYTDPEPSYKIGLEETRPCPENPKLKPILIVKSSTFSIPVTLLLKLRVDSKVSVDIYDCCGRKIVYAMKEKFLSSGVHNLSIGHKDERFYSGVFFVRLTVHESAGKTYNLKRKLILLQ